MLNGHSSSFHSGSVFSVGGSVVNDDHVEGFQTQAEMVSTVAISCMPVISRMHLSLSPFGARV